MPPSPRVPVTLYRPIDCRMRVRPAPAAGPSLYLFSKGVAGAIIGVPMRSRFAIAPVVLTIAVAAVLLRPVQSQTRTPRAENVEAPLSAQDQDLLEVSIPQLHRFYATRKYTVTQVVEWHLARVAKY